MNRRKLGLSSGIVLMFGGFYTLWAWGLQQVDDVEGVGVYFAAAPLAALSAVLFAFAGIIGGDMLREWWEWLHHD